MGEKILTDICEIQIQGGTNMKNRILSLLAAAVLLLLLPLSVAGADGVAYWDPQSRSFLYTEPHYGIVICTKMNVRNRAATSGSAYGSIRNGQPVKILGTSENDDFYVLDLASCGFSNASATYGYAKKSLISIDPEYFATTKTTNLYATPWGDGLKNGEQNNRYFLIISEHSGWYAVQATENSPGTAFVKMSDVSRTYQGRYVVTWDTQLLDESSWAQIQNVKRFTVGRLVQNQGDYSLMIFNEGAANEFRAWILTQYIAPLLN